MNLRRYKQMFWTLTALFSASGAAAMILAVVLPYAQPEVIGLEPHQKPPDPVSHRSKAIGLQQFAGVWGNNLRAPLIDEPNELMNDNLQTNKPAVSRPDIKLIGYAVELDHSLAILLGPDNSIAYATVGEKLHGVTVHAITSQGVTLDFNGEQYLLPIDEQAGDARAPQQIRRADRSRERPVKY